MRPWVAEPRDTRTREEREQDEAAHRYEVLRAVCGDLDRRTLIVRDSPED